MGSELEIRPRHFNFRFRSAEHWIEFFRDNFGPVKTAVERLDERGRDALAADVSANLERFDRGGDRALVVPAEYLEVIATRA